MAKSKANGKTPPSNVGGQLLGFIERIERLIGEKKALGEDIKEIKAEAKGMGFDNKVIMRIIADRAKDQDDLNEFEALVETYKASIATIDPL